MDVLASNIVENYRDVKAVNYSLLKALDLVGPKVLVEGMPEVDSSAIRIGSLVDTLLLDPKQLFLKFYHYPIPELPPSLEKLANEALIRNETNLDKIEELSKKLELLNNIKDTEKRKKYIDNPAFWEYLKIKNEAKGKTLITTEEYNYGMTVGTVLKTHDFTKYIFEESPTQSIYFHFPFTTTVFDTLVKCEVDIVRINHSLKFIELYDLKIGTKSVFNKNFYDLRWYLQSALYQLAFNNFLRETNQFRNYRTLNFQFISCDDSYPIKYIINNEWFEAGIEGFRTYGGTHYKGIKELLNDYKFYNEFKEYSVPRDLIENSGIRHFPVPTWLINQEHI